MFQSFLLLLTSIFLFFGCIGNNSTEINNVQNDPIQMNESTNIVTTTTMRTFSLSEVSIHNSTGDCWLVIHGKIYDVTDFIPSHPGGNAILQGCGADATDLYETRLMGSGTPHSQNAMDLLSIYYVGDIK